MIPLELFLQLSCEFKGASLPKNADFEAYWTTLKGAGIDLTSNLIAMRRLNKVRVSLKHSGIMPDSLDLIGIANILGDFFECTTPQVFGIEFETVTRSFLVRSDKERELLICAEAALRNGNYNKSLEDMTRAFHIAMAFREDNRRYDPRGRVHNVNFFNFPSQVKGDQKFANALKDMSDTFGEALLIVGYNLDFDSYRIFRAHAPVIYNPTSEKYVCQWLKAEVEDGKIVERCLDFVTDVCLTLTAAG